MSVRESEMCVYERERCVHVSVCEREREGDVCDSVREKEMCVSFWVRV